MKKDNKDSDISGALGGTLNILGMKIDLAKLISSPEEVKDSLEELRKKLKAAGGKKSLSDEEWKHGGISITGNIRTHGLLGENEFHVGTSGKPGGKIRGQTAPVAPEVIEPPVDVFYEGQQVTIVADVPGASLENLELKVQGDIFSLSSKAKARRNYQKELHLKADVEPDSLQSTCRNGVLEVRLQKRVAGKG